MQLIKEEYFSRLIELLPVILYTCDTKGIITSYNREAESFWGKTPVTGEDKYNFSYEVYDTEGKLLDIENTPMGLTLKHGKPYSGDILIKNSHDQELYIKSTPKPLFNTSGTFVGVLSCCFDVTEYYTRLNKQKKKNIL